MPEFQSFTLQAYTKLTLTARVIVHHATISSNPVWLEIRKNLKYDWKNDLKYELIFLAILLLVLTVVVAI